MGGGGGQRGADALGRFLSCEVAVRSTHRRRELVPLVCTHGTERQTLGSDLELARNEAVLSRGKGISVSTVVGAWSGVGIG